MWIKLKGQCINLDNVLYYEPLGTYPGIRFSLAYGNAFAVKLRNDDEAVRCIRALNVLVMANKLIDEE